MHPILVAFINENFPSYVITLRQSTISSGNIHNKVSVSDAHNMAVILANLIPTNGGSVGSIDFHEFLRGYLTGMDKRQKINEVLRLPL